MKTSTQLRPYAIIVTMVIVFSCSQKNNEHNDHHPDAATEVANTPIPDFKEVDLAIKTQLNTFLDGYFALNQSLIEDSFERSKVAAGKLLETTKSIEVSKLSGEQMDFYFVQSSKLKSGLQEISSSTDIDKARNGLGAVSEAMYALVKAFHPNESPLYYQYCPMAKNNEGANWLSATEELVNPYMGKIMLECGRTQEKLD